MTNFLAESGIVSIRNFRDLGGYQVGPGRRVRSRMLYRSGHFADACPADVDHLVQLGIRTIIDLRRKEETERYPSLMDQAPKVTVLKMPLLDPGKVYSSRKSSVGSPSDALKSMYRVYENMVTDEHSVKCLRDIFDIVCDIRRYPIILHCSAGKDRTGVVCALILLALGVSVDDVIADYYRSQQLFTNALTTFESPEAQAGSVAEITNRRVLYDANPAYLMASIQAIHDSHGSMGEFFCQALGLCRIKNQLLKDVLTEMET